MPSFVVTIKLPSTCLLIFSARYPKVKPGGYIGGHDYQKDWPGVVTAIHEIIGYPEKVFDDGSWIKQKPKKISQKRLV